MVLAGYMAQHLAKIGTDDDLFLKLRNQLDEEAKKARETLVPNLKGSVRLVPSKQKFLGKDTKKLRPKLLDQASSSGVGSKAFDLGRLESPIIENELKLVEEVELATLIRASLEIQSLSLVLDHKVANFLIKEMVDRDKTKLVEELASCWGKSASECIAMLALARDAKPKAPGSNHAQASLGACPSVNQGSCGAWALVFLAQASSGRRPGAKSVAQATSDDIPLAIFAFFSPSAHSKKKNQEPGLNKEIDTLNKDVVEEKERKRSTWLGIPMTPIRKSGRKTTMVEEVIDEDTSKEEIFKVKPSVVVEPMNEDEEIVNHEVEANEWMITTCIDKGSSLGLPGHKPPLLAVSNQEEKQEKGKRKEKVRKEKFEKKKKELTARKGWEEDKRVRLKQYWKKKVKSHEEGAQKGSKRHQEGRKPEAQATGKKNSELENDAGSPGDGPDAQATDARTLGVQNWRPSLTEPLIHTWSNSLRHLSDPGALGFGSLAEDNIQYTPSQFLVPPCLWGTNFYLLSGNEVLVELLLRVILLRDEANLNHWWGSHSSINQNQYEQVGGLFTSPPQDVITTKLEETLQQFLKDSISFRKNILASSQNFGAQCKVLTQKLIEFTNNQRPQKDCKVVATRSGKVLNERGERETQEYEKKEEEKKERLREKEKIKKESEKQESERREKEKKSEEENEKKKREVFEKSLPYPKYYSRKEKEKQFEHFMEIFKKLENNIPFSEALQQMPSYAKFLKELLSKKRKYIEEETIEVQGNCNTIIQKSIPPKLKDSGSFTIPCTIGNISNIKGLELKPTRMTLQLADRSLKYPHGVAEDVLVKVDKFLFPVDFVIMEMEEDVHVPLILGRPFMKTARVLIDVENGKLKVRVQDEEVNFDVFQAMSHPKDNKDCFHLDTLDKLCMIQENEACDIPSLEETFDDNYEEVTGEDNRKIFSRFGTPRVLISDGGSHFCNHHLAKVLKHYGVKHMVATPYHPQTNGQAELSNREIKRILEKTVTTSRKDWSQRLDDALWAYRTAMKAAIGLSPFQMVYGKACHLPVEMEHKALWALKFLNLDPGDTAEKRRRQIIELEEMRLHAYESSKNYKEKVKYYHDKKLIKRASMPAQQSKWSGPFLIKKILPHGAVELTDPSSEDPQRSWIVNGQRLKCYLGGEVERFSTFMQLVDVT
ncbi:hypothetical protein V8G54_013629 [Vigna mungo]|uniref:Integrase catalytic domain-containing protein n=1 Tax=Vigna mungo TaxID=3915 RepID=A0AAQ3NV18_VIGMU